MNKVDLSTSDFDDVKKRCDEILDKHAAMLAEDFDTVLILVTKLRADGTTYGKALGTGNWYARYGHMLDYMEKLKSEHITRRLNS